MGLFDFVKNAGEKLGFGKDEPKTPAPQAPTMDDVKRASDRRRAMGLAKRVGELGIAVEDLNVRVDGDVATVSGKVSSQADREKVVLAIGNVEGIAKVNDDGLEVESPEPMAQFHTVERGDTLSKIAKQYYGNAMKYPVIFEANKPMLSDPDKIYPGQKLRIPPLES